MRRGSDKGGVYLGLVMLLSLLAVGLCYHGARKALLNEYMASPVQSFRFKGDEFISYKWHEYMSFFPKELADKLDLKENIIHTDDVFRSKAGILSSEPFDPSPFMIVPALGGDPESVHTLELPRIFVRCVADGRQMQLLHAPSEGWFFLPVEMSALGCVGKVEIVGISPQDRVHVGIGTPVRVSRLVWQMMQPQGSVVAAVLALALVSLVMMPILASAGISILSRILYACLYPTLFGFSAYVLFWCVPDHYKRMAIAIGLVGLPLFVMTLQSVRLRVWPDWRAARLFGVGLSAVGILCIGAYFISPIGNGFWFPAYAFFPASWSTDNLLSVMMARNLVLVGPGHPEFLGNWSISDRGIIQAGTFCVAFLLPGLGPIFLSSPINNVISNIYGCLLQGLPFPLAVVFFASLGWSRRRILIAAVIITASPFFIFNSFYIWPKLYGGMLVPVAILALWYGLRRSSMWGLCLAISGYAIASMNHSSNLLAVPAIFLYFVASLLTGHHRWEEVSALARRGWAASLAVALVMLLGLKSAEFFEPKSSWPILFLVTGEGQFGLSSAQVHERIFEFVRHIDPVALFKARVGRLSDLVWITDGFFTRNQPWPSLRFARAVEEFSLLPSLGPGLVLLFAVALMRPGLRYHAHAATTAPFAHAPTPDLGTRSEKATTASLIRQGASVRDDDDLTRTMNLLWICCVANLLILALLQGAQPVVHQLPYGLIEGMILGLIVANRKRRNLLIAAALLQSVNALLVWYVGAWGFWHERL